MARYILVKFSSSILCPALCSLAGILGLLPNWASAYMVKNSIGSSWSTTAIEATCTHLLKVSYSNYAAKKLSACLSTRSLYTGLVMFIYWSLHWQHIWIIIY